tara:strand:- start:35 stop:835 length:801 start_codon:yes stop_codon:yes gene_type:complete
MEPMRVATAYAKPDFAKRKKRAMIACSILGIVLAGIVIFLSTPIAETLMRKRLEHLAQNAVQETDRAIQHAATIRRRSTHGEANLSKDLGVMKEIVHAQSSIANAIKAAQASVVQRAQKVSEEAKAVEKELARDKAETEGALHAVVKAVEMDVAARAGHPLMLKDGVPISDANKAIEALGDAIFAINQQEDKITAATEVLVEDASNLPVEATLERSSAKAKVDVATQTLKLLHKKEEELVQKIEKEATSASTADEKGLLNFLKTRA